MSEVRELMELLVAVIIVMSLAILTCLVLIIDLVWTVNDLRIENRNLRFEELHK